MFYLTDHKGRWRKDSRLSNIGVSCTGVQPQSFKRISVEQFAHVGTMQLEALVSRFIVTDEV